MGLAQIPNRVDRIINVEYLVVVEGSDDVEHSIDGLNMGEESIS